MDKTVNLQNFIMTIDNMLSSEVCDFIVDEMVNPDSFKNKTTMENRTGRQDTQKNGGLFLSHLTSLQVDAKKTFECNPKAKVNEIFLHCIKEGLDVYVKTMPEGLKPFIASSLVDFTEFKFQETHVGGGFHDWHFENGTNETKCRFLVWSIFLNDVQEGGELEFVYQNKRIKPKKGTIALFPAYFTHTHRGNPPISNNKFIATGWFYTFNDN